MADIEDLKIAVVCSSNQNRSMEAHSFLSKKGFNVKSFGTGNMVKLPGPAPDKPNIYDFTITYDAMYRDLMKKDYELYTQNGILHMLDRNRRIKANPERFQLSKEKFDLIITCEERVYDQVLEDFENRERNDEQAVHIINIDIQDNHEEATIGAFMICELVTMLYASEDLDNEVDEILQEFENKKSRIAINEAFGRVHSHKAHTEPIQADTIPNIREAVDSYMNLYRRIFTADKQSSS